MSFELNADAQHMKEPERKIPCKIYSRIVGYYAPLDNWNIGMRQQFEDRMEYKQEKFHLEPIAEKV